jgi:hypothetical protein
VRTPRKGWAEAAAEAHAADSANAKASEYQIAASRIEILAWDLMGLETPDANKLDAYAGAIWALARLAQRENEV